MSEKNAWRDWLRMGLAVAAVMVAIGVAGPAVVCAAPPSAAKTSRPAFHGILWNDDGGCTLGCDPAGTIKPERLDQAVDRLADSQVTILLINVNDKLVYYPSKVWEVAGTGFDPAKDNNQPFFDGVAPGWAATLRPMFHNLRKLLDEGVDPWQRMIDRCRQRNISPWISIRMNDAHDATLPKSPLHSRFWLEHPEYRLPNRNMNIGLNYGLKPVRDQMMALLRRSVRPLRHGWPGTGLEPISFELPRGRGDRAGQDAHRVDRRGPRPGARGREEVEASDLPGGACSRPAGGVAGHGFRRRHVGQTRPDRPPHRRAVLGDDGFRYPRGAVERAPEGHGGRRDRRAGI